MATLEAPEDPSGWQLSQSKILNSHPAMLELQAKMDNLVQQGFSMRSGEYYELKKKKYAKKKKKLSPASEEERDPGSVLGASEA